MKNGQVCSIVRENLPIPSCTVSGELMPGVICFSLAAGTDISAESYPVPVLQYNLAGSTVLEYRTGSEPLFVDIREGEAVMKAAGMDIGVKSNTDSVYLEIVLREETDMNEIIKAGEAFQVKDLVPYQEGKIVNMDIASNESMKFVVMVFDEGTGLSEHAAPGEAIVFALDGEATIGYEGSEYPLRAGEQFKFAKGGLHSVKANGKFKMALLLVLK